MPTQRKSAQHRAFTLIELLVVVGVIAIVSSIALGNYQESQTRAKSARVMADLRTLMTGIEMYSVDHGRVPRMAHNRFYSDPAFDVVADQSVNGIPSRVLSTPVSYVSNPFIRDPFLVSIGKARVDEQIYTYQDLSAYVVHSPRSTFWPQALEYYGSWRLGSAGPDGTFDHGFKNSAQLPYDPTNGTVSLGNIWYSQRRARELTLPPTEMLGSH